MANILPPIAWGDFGDGFVDELSRWIGGRSVLEVFAGNGLLASKLAGKGVDILATSLLSGHDGHDRGMQHEILEMEASAAVRAFGEGRDILLMSWPVASEAALKAALAWGDEKPIVFIGEVTRHDLGLSGLGGCASDLFFEATKEVAAFEAYQPRSGLDRASIRTLDPAVVSRLAATARPGPAMR